MTLKTCVRRLSSLLLPLILCSTGFAAPTGSPPPIDVSHGLAVSENGRYLVDAQTRSPVFLLADTAWNLGALNLEEIDLYLQNRAGHGFNTVMFSLNFHPQANEKNAYGEPAYLGNDKTDLNPAYLEYCDKVVKMAADRNMFVMIYTMWAGPRAGTMNNYTAEQLSKVGRALGAKYKGVKNVIFCVGGEASPHYIEVERPMALGRAMHEGCGGQNLITIHPVSGNSSSKFYLNEPWLSFHMSHAKSGMRQVNTDYDAAALVLGDSGIKPIKPAMMSEHRYESGTAEDPLIQRRSMYQCVFAGGFGYAYGHNALWQMSPHTAQEWMLGGWAPGVDDWKKALDTPAAGQLKHITKLLHSYPYLTRIPDQSLVLEGQGTDIYTRTQVTRDGTTGKKDATYILAYISAPRAVTLDTSVLSAARIDIHRFDPATGQSQTIRERVENTGKLTLEQRPEGQDCVMVIEAAKN